MIIRRTQLTLSLFLLLSSLVSAAEEAPFDCHITLASAKYDLTKLAGPHTVSRTRDTPPTTMVDTLTFDLCADLKAQDGVKDKDQCEPGTRACLTKTNKKEGDTDRIVSVIPIAQASVLKPDFVALSSPKALSLTLHGGSYPSSPNTTPIPQSLNLTLICNPDTTSGPTFTSYDAGVLSVEWTAPEGCAVTGGDTPPIDGDKGGKDDEKKDEEKVGSGIGWFFLVLFLAFLAYFGLGAYYNYTTYGASGVDLIPHRDFWQEVPYMMRDVVSHLCSSVRSKRPSQRGGYMSV